MPKNLTIYCEDIILRNTVVINFTVNKKIHFDIKCIYNPKPYHALAIYCSVEIHRAYYNLSFSTN